MEEAYWDFSYGKIFAQVVPRIDIIKNITRRRRVGSVAL
jgi:hypothetical protein